MPVRSLILITGALFAAVTTLTPAASLAEPAAIASAAPAQEPADGVTRADLDALRYYRLSGQTDKYDAELRRLQRLHPDWTPPPISDLERGDGSDIQPLWDLLGAGRYVELEADIAVRRQNSPGWQPPAKLIAELETAVAAERLINASDSQQWETVVRIAGNNPDLLTCARVDSVWRTAEAEAQLGARAAAEARYRAVVESCPEAQVRLATVQKAKATLGLSTAERLIALERARGETAQPDAAEAAALAEIERDLAQGRLAAAAAEGRRLPAEELARLHDRAQRERDAALAVNLGWYDYNAGRPGAASTWFDRALGWEPSASAALGLVLALRDSGQTAAAEQVAADWQARAPRVREVYVGLILSRLNDDPAPEAGQLARYAQIAETVRSPDLANAFGWRTYADGAYEAAAEWFARSLAWAPSRNAAEGRILALRQAGRTNEAAAALADLTESYPELANALPQGGLSPSLAAAVEADDYGACVRAGLALREAGSLAGADAQQFGWCLLALGRPAEALRAFETAARAAQAPDTPASDAAQLAADARIGRAYALLGLGQSLDVARLLASGSVADPQRRDLRALVLAQFASDAMRNGHYRTTLALLAERRAFAPPSRGLRELEGWAYYRLNDNAAAERIFNQLNAEFSTEETRHALSVVRKFTYRR